jgi:hypothetical protein
MTAGEHRRAIICISALFVVLGIFFFSMGLYLAFQTKAFLKSGIRTQAQIVDFELRSSSGSQAAVFVFTNRSGDHMRTASTMSSNPRSGKVGDVVGVIYSANDPKIARIDSFKEKWAIPAVFGGLGLMATTIGGFVLYLKRGFSKVV